MATFDKDKLSRLVSETEDLHPLLDSLLRKLPGIADVEYTHGPEEMGADFVLAKSDSTLGNTHYVGVVAKVGKIVQDFSDIERQIDECSLPRLFRGGREKIRIEETWVVVTQHITKGAQDKIHEKYTNRRIEFIDGARLTALIDQHLPLYWTDVSIAAGEYLTALRARNEQIDHSLSLMHLSDKAFYIEQDIYEFPRLEYRLELQRKQKQARKVTIPELLGESKLVLVEGSMGSGKSKLLRQIVALCTTPEIFLQSKVLPVVITYSDLVELYARNLAEVIAKQVPANLIEADPELRFLLLIDAFDEKNIPVEQQVSEIRALAESMKAFPKAKVI
ncbi:MAG: NACHT domain-containing protein, partial [Planctomycetes bacterium]|nr:NACHT domain-containing protein [Planctomycetota bacterium]